MTQTDAPEAKLSNTQPEIKAPPSAEPFVRVDNQEVVPIEGHIPPTEPFDWKKWAKLAALLALLLLGLLMGMREGPFVDIMDWSGLGTTLGNTVRLAGKAAEVPGMATEKNPWLDGLARKVNVEKEVKPTETSKGWFSGWWSEEAPWRPSKGVDSLDEWKGEMPGTLPARRGLEGTSPDLGLTKEWLHTLALRFDGSANSWNSLRSANDFGCRNEGNAKKKKCRDEYWGANKYVACRIAHSYDHHIYGI